MKYPIISCYPFHANLLSVISQTDDYFPWLFNYYIQLVCPRDFRRRGVRLDFYTTLLWKTCPWAYYQRVSREFALLGRVSVHDFIVDAINMGYYPYFTIDEYYVSSYDSFKKRHAIHDIFVFGYDREKETVEVADNFRDGRYSYEEVPAREVQVGFENVQETGKREWMDGIELISFRRKTNYFDEIMHEYTFDLDLAKSFFDDYLSSRNTVKRYGVPSEQWRSGDDWVYGVSVYELLIEYLETFRKGGFFLDWRPFHVLWEHKKVMLLRLGYLQREHCDLPDSLISSYSDVEKKLLVARNLWVKFILTRDESILERIRVILLSVSSQEKQLLQTVVGLL